MNTKELIHIIQSTPSEIEFSDVIAVIDNDYTYSATQFYNGVGENEIVNAAGTNEGSCKIFSFADLNDLNEAQTLACFGKYYRQDVLLNLNGSDHENIRNFMKYGWDGIHFDSPPLSIED